MELKFKKAIEAMKNAYAPFSKFHVGACLVLKNGEFIIGANVENSSYGLTNCAERSALFAAYSQGYRKEDISEIIIATNNEIPSSPCGACRQVIFELMNRDALVTMINPNLTNTISVKVKELLPFGFDEEKLNETKSI